MQSSQSPVAPAKSMSKTEMIQALALESGLERKQCAQVVDALSKVISKQLGKEGPGVLVLLGLLKITKQVKPAVAAGTRPNPFKKGEMMEVKEKPACTLPKVKALKALKDMMS